MDQEQESMSRGLNSGDLKVFWEKLYNPSTVWEHAVRAEVGGQGPDVGATEVIEALARMSDEVAERSETILDLIDQQEDDPARRLLRKSIIASIIDRSRLRDAFLHRHLARHRGEALDPLLEKEVGYAALALSVVLNREEPLVGRDHTIRSRILEKIIAPGQKGRNNDPGIAAAGEEGRVFVWRGRVAYMGGDEVEGKFENGPLVNAILYSRDDNHLVYKALTARRGVVPPNAPRPRQARLGEHLTTLGYSRQEVNTLIADNNVEVDGRAVENFRVQVDSRSTIVVDGERVASPSPRPGQLALDDLFLLGLDPAAYDLDPLSDDTRFLNFSERLFGERLGPEELKTLSDEASARLGGALSEINGLSAIEPASARARFVVMWLIESAEITVLCALFPKNPDEIDHNTRRIRNRVGQAKSRSRKHLLRRVLTPDFDLPLASVKAGLVQAIKSPNDDDKQRLASLKHAIGFVGVEQILQELIGEWR